jgi:hypothetical protein
MKLLGISLGALLVAAMLWTTLWFWGQSLTYKQYDHPLLSWSPVQGQPVLALNTDSFQEASEFLKKNPDSILEINLRVTSEGLLYTAPDASLDFIFQLPKTDASAYKGNKSFYYSYEFLTSHAPGVVPIEKWMELKPRFWIFNIVDNAMDIDKNLTLWVEKNKMENLIVLTAEADIVISSLKDKNPLWIFGTSLSDLTKLLTLESIHLEALAPFKRDYFITPVRLGIGAKDREVLNPVLVKEMKRRLKKVAIGPVHTDQDREKALNLQPDILILSSDTLQNSSKQ